MTLANPDPIKKMLTHIGYDDWSRSLWQLNDTDIVYVDVDGELHTRTPDWGEPCTPLGIGTPEILEDK